MKVGVFSCKPYDRAIFAERGAHYGFDLIYIDSPLNIETLALAKPFDAICISMHDEVSAEVLEALEKFDVEHIALRCAGFNNVDIEKAKALGITVSHVPHYSSESVAEHTLALILSLDRKLLKANNQILHNNFESNGLLGFDLRGKTIGIIGVGHVGRTLIKILAGFSCRILCYDPVPLDAVSALGHEYVELSQLIKESDIISLHCPLNAQTQHMIGHTQINDMKDNVMLINTSPSLLINTKAMISGLKSNKIGYLGIDIYEMETESSSESITCQKISHDTYRRLATFPNVLLTSHQGFFTRECLQKTTDTTLVNLQYHFAGKVCSDTFLS